MNIESNYKELYNEFSRSHFKLSEIRNHLLNQNYQEGDVDQIINKYISHKCDLRTSRGCVYVLTGGAFLLTSMALTFFNVMPEMRGLILYGLTSIGICIAVAGLYLLFEKENIE
jgi:hypothetical protein